MNAVEIAFFLRAGARVIRFNDLQPDKTYLHELIYKGRRFLHSTTDQVSVKGQL